MTDNEADMLVAPSVSDSEPATIVLAAIRRPKLLRGCRTAFIRQDDAVVTLWNVIVTFGNIVMGLLVCYQLAWS